MQKKPKRICRNGCGIPVYTEDDQLCKKCLMKLNKKLKK